MWQSVLDAFVRFSTPLEGSVPSLYADIRGLLTVGIGCLCDPVQSALSLPWVMPDGSMAWRDEIARQWRVVKADADRLSKLDWHEAAKLTTMRLSDAGVLQVAMSRLLSNEVMMRKAFPVWEAWPADAQLYACSMSWAVGAGWPEIFGNCTRLLNQSPPGFLLAATGAPNAKPTDASAPCDIRVGTNYGIVPRNAQNRLCLTNAQVVQEQGLDPSVLHWPRSPLNDTERPPPMGEA